MSKINIAYIGYGKRSQCILGGTLAPMLKNDVNILSVCDLYEDRAKAAADAVEELTGNRPFETTEYLSAINVSGVDAVLVETAWESHIDIACAAMECGKHVAIEVGGAYSVEDCWRMIRTQEKTGKQCMLLENCCYGRYEMMVMNIVSQGLFGDVVHCSGAYAHDLRSEISNGLADRHYRFRNYLNRNCENYPTHELGPIAQILQINRGNRMLSLTSTASCAKGLNEYNRITNGADHPYATENFAQGDIVTTVIRCSKGQTITLVLDTTLPRYYGRAFTVRGTKGAYFEENNSLYFDGEHNQYEGDWSQQWGNAKILADKYDHPVWQTYKQNPIGGHDGMDWLVLTEFFKAIKNETEVPIDVYDAAAWMSISTLSEHSINSGSAPVEIPDFTNGKWVIR